jgi:hypothetical protein
MALLVAIVIRCCFVKKLWRESRVPTLSKWGVAEMRDERRDQIMIQLF